MTTNNGVTMNRVLILNDEETKIVCDAIDSHRYWQLSASHYRRDGHVMDPGSDDPEAAAALKSSDELQQRIIAATPDRSVLSPVERKIVREALDSHIYATHGSFHPDAKAEIAAARALDDRLKAESEGKAAEITTALTMPLVNLNGTDKDSLLDSYCEVHLAMNKALEKMMQNGPNARDYPVEGTYAKARQEHVARCAKVRAAMEEVNAIMEYLAE